MKRILIRQSGKSNNRGVSFLELIVVIAIMALMTSLAGAGIGMLINADSKKAAKNTYNLLSELRTDTLSGNGQWTGEITRASANGQYLFTIKNNGNIMQQETLGSRLDIMVGVNSPLTTADAITASDTIEIKFQQGTGRTITVKKNGADITSASGSNKVYIEVKSNSGRSYKLTLWKLTGKVSTDY